MAFWRFITLIFILSSCAQVGTITGGEKDTSPPKPVKGRVFPPNGSLGFDFKKVRIPFDEYIQLNNPAQNIKMIPPHATIYSKLKGKVLELSWEEDLQPNTTYAIYLNRAVKDFSEGNDSIMQYVFSTGNTLDTLQMNFFTVDAWTAKPVSNVTVALFDTTTNELVNFTSSDKNGIAELKYLSPRNYRVKAFKDDNNDIEVQEYESQGYLENDLVNPLDSTENLFRMIPPDLVPQFSELHYRSPGNFFVGANVPLEDVTVSLSGNPYHQFKFLAEDSLQFFVNEDTISTVEIAIQSTQISDTISKKIYPGQKSGRINIKMAQNEAFSPKDSFSLEVNSWITEINPEQIKVIKATDSSELIVDNISFETNILNIHFDRSQSSQVVVVVDSMAIKTLNGWAPKSRLLATLNPARKYGNLIISETEHTDFNRIVFVMKNDKALYETVLKKGEESSTIELVNADFYWFKVILDKNQDGKWNKGSVEDKVEPETILLFTDPSKVRANWDIEVKLERKEPVQHE